MIWISSKIFTWPVSRSSWTPGDYWGARRAYELLDHAERILNPNSDRNQRADVISNLKRAVDHRLKILNDLYRFKGIPIQDLPKEQLDVMQRFGIVRQLMLGKLYDIRNAVEHEDSPPPSHDSIKELAEFVWYFLRTTDRLARDKGMATKYSTWSIEAGDRLFEVEFVTENPWELKVRCWLDEDMYSETSKDDWLLAMPSEQRYVYGDPEHIQNKNLPGVREFFGTLRGHEHAIRRLIREYFESA